MAGAGCEDMAAAGSEGRRGVRMSLRLGAASVDAIVAVVDCDVYIVPFDFLVVDSDCDCDCSCFDRVGGAMCMYGRD